MPEITIEINKKTPTKQLTAKLIIIKRPLLLDTNLYIKMNKEINKLVREHKVCVIAGDVHQIESLEKEIDFLNYNHILYQVVT